MSEPDSISEILRAHDRERYLASLFIPAAKREAVMALYAFSAEIARVRDMVSEPLPGEVRLQWWRDVLTGDGRGDVTRHPIAAALLKAIDGERLPVQPFLDLIDARSFDLYDDPMPTLHDLEGYCGETSSALFRLASLVLADEGQAGPADAAGHAGVAYGITSVLQALRRHTARGQCFVPADLLARHGATAAMLQATAASPAVKAALAELVTHARSHLDQTRAQLAHMPAPVRPAFRPLAIVAPILTHLSSPAFDPLTDEAEIALWRKQWAMWRWRIR